MANAADNREGRGRLSSIDLLPEEAEEDVVWALEQLRDRKQSQVVILVGLNDRLVAKGIEPISKSAFNRYAVRKAVQFRRLDEGQRIASEVAGALGTAGADQMTVAIAEMLKLAIFERLETGELDPKSIMELGRAISSAVGAQKASAEHRRKLQEEALARVDKAIDKAGEALAEDSTLAADPAAVLQKIREDVYGIFDR
ncbi:MAG: DUF3486 family protein [Altererythrobacter sp.]|nr:DUF3486 family protein [Altererythrobacter sp.]OJU60949.1 MAG: hypothetical protein BGO08_12550 [Altererythrobacter sp. 66-12]